MTDAQLKTLAEMLLIHDEKIELIARILTNLIERKISEGDDFDGRANILLSSIEQLSAFDRDAAAARDQLRQLLCLL
jgi:hypothetical protein